VDDLDLDAGYLTVSHHAMVVNPDWTIVGGGIIGSNPYNPYSSGRGYDFNQNVPFVSHHDMDLIRYMAFAQWMVLGGWLGALTPYRVGSATPGFPAPSRPPVQLVPIRGCSTGCLPPDRKWKLGTRYLSAQADASAAAAAQAAAEAAAAEAAHQARVLQDALTLHPRPTSVASISPDMQAAIDAANNQTP
jgi:hypothetical protein